MLSCANAPAAAGTKPPNPLELDAKPWPVGKAAVGAASGPIAKDASSPCVIVNSSSRYSKPAAINKSEARVSTGSA